MIDRFGPMSEPYCDYFELPKHIKVVMIDDISKIGMMDELFNEKYIGVDCEWRP